MLRIILFLCIIFNIVHTEVVKLLPPTKDHIYFGAFPDFGGPEDKVSTQKVRDFETLVGKKIVWAYFSQNWFNGITYPKADIHAISKSGAIPFVRLMPRSDESQGEKERTFTLSRIITGKFDTALRRWAKDAKKDNIPLLVDFAVEPNGDWFPWSGVLNGGGTTNAYGDPNYPDGPERFRDAYRHIITLFKEEGAEHITWFFHFNYVSIPDTAWNQPRYYYPEDDYIDWVGFSLYGAQTHDETWDGLAFSTQLKAYISGYHTLSTEKPVALLEFGVTDNHPQGNKAKWFDDAFATILNNPYIHFKAIAPWHENWENEDGSYSTLRLDSSTETTKHFREWIKNPRFVTKPRFEHSCYRFLPAVYGLLAN